MENDDKLISLMDQIKKITHDAKKINEERDNLINKSFYTFLEKSAGQGGLSEEYRILWKATKPDERRFLILAARRISRFWYKTFNKKPEFLFIEGRKIIERLLMNFSEQDCKDAILGCSLSKFHMGENENSRIYNSIELIFRNDIKTRKFISYLTEENQKSRQKRGDEFDEFWRD